MKAIKNGIKTTIEGKKYTKCSKKELMDNIIIKNIDSDEALSMYNNTFGKETEDLEKLQVSKNKKNKK